MAMRPLAILAGFLVSLTWMVSVSARDDLVEYLSGAIQPLDGPSRVEPILEDMPGRRLVLLGEASHGTEEFYRWRAELSKGLIREQGFSFIAVEGDWAALYRLNEYVKGRPGAGASAREVLEGFDRWPPWMWGNTAVEELAEWLRDHNADLAEDERVGFYGMDVFGHWDALDDLLAFTAEHLPEHHDRIAEKLACFEGQERDEWWYARTASAGGTSCEEELARVVSLMRSEGESLAEKTGKAYFRAKHNALVVQNAEDYYRLAGQDRARSWNSRVNHMWLTVQRLMDLHGDGAKGIVWAHNTHVGDARATAMAGQGMVNIGEISRRELGEDDVFILGFGTYSGEVNAGRQWGTPMAIMTIPDGAPGSIEHLFRQLPAEEFYLRLGVEARTREDFNQVRGHRAIGVVYNPANEGGNYVPTVFPRRYDGFIFIRHTQALTPVR